MEDDTRQHLEAGLAAMGIETSPALIAALSRYLALLRAWNRAYNLTSITDPDDMVVRHILDSATARPFLRGAAILDVGTGAGLPGVPLALLEPSRRFTLLDSIGKKIRFLRQVVAELQLSNITPVQARLEQWRCAEPFDTVVCRALGPLADFAASCGRLLSARGRLVAMKGRLPTREIATLPSHWHVAQLERVTVPGLTGERHIVVLERSDHG